MYVVLVVTQIGICFICWTLGSSLELRRFKLTVEIGPSGQARLKFRLKESFDELEVSISARTES